MDDVWKSSQWCYWTLLIHIYLNVDMHVIVESYHELLPCNVLYYTNVLAYGDLNGVLIASTVMGYYFHIALVWLRGCRL